MTRGDAMTGTTAMIPGLVNCHHTTEVRFVRLQWTPGQGAPQPPLWQDNCGAPCRAAFSNSNIPPLARNSMRNWPATQPMRRALAWSDNSNGGRVARHIGCSVWVCERHMAKLRRTARANSWNALQLDGPFPRTPGTVVPKALECAGRAFVWVVECRTLRRLKGHGRSRRRSFL